MKLKKIFFTLASFFLFALLQQAEVAADEAQGIKWMTNYENALQLAKETERPIVLFFTGSDWCGWCNKLEKEVFDTQEFMGTTSDKLIFVKLDFPAKKSLDPLTKSQNEKLQKKFSVRSYPTVVVLDTDQMPIGVTGYRSGGGKQYAQHLFKMVNEYTAYKQQVKRLGSHQFSGKELKRLYQKSQELSLKDDQNLIIRIGTDSDLPHFFLTERYRHLVSNGKMNSIEAASLKQRLDSLDLENQFLTHYQLAVIDFEALSQDAETSTGTPEAIVAPLIVYIQRFGDGDTENLWRLSLIISQVYLDHNRLNDALKYAERSLAAAPQAIQPDIALTIKNIHTQLESVN